MFNVLQTHKDHEGLNADIRNAYLFESSGS